MKKIIQKLLGRSGDPIDDAAHDLYTQLVDQARQPVFYLDYAVADTVDGRFDMIALHAFMVIRRLKTSKDEKAAELAQAIYDVMFKDMDRGLREMGVGDMSISKKIKAMVEAFNGRVTVYENALTNQEEPRALQDAFFRNIYRETAVDNAVLDRLVAYVKDQLDDLDDQSVEALLAGKVRFQVP